jgi:hypothetical protein
MGSAEVAYMSEEQNPYNCSSPGHLFVGYDSMRHDVLSGFRNGKSYALLGGRRCGKTSLLLKLEHDLQRVGVVSFCVLPRLLDIQAVVPRSPLEFFRTVYQAIVKDLPVRSWNSWGESQHYQEFLRVLDAAKPAIASALARIDPPLLIKGDPPSFKLSSN